MFRISFLAHSDVKCVHLSAYNLVMCSIEQLTIFTLRSSHFVAANRMQAGCRCYDSTPHDAPMQTHRQRNHLEFGLTLALLFGNLCFCQKKFLF